ncbi:GntR family transcriptional regulator [Acidaminobacter sp. JC074]|uniref:GntR family transcriptional regulator n=1 Tax=Acidaminobacter sp. JC074 TaxID=2530199 RepID=UPI001F0CFC60|nr:GntR family transcriptional regulator [Acidaminobacter sp. JC074]MCH4886925.1 GntR family transcriptional regulator [Acidaminobacter sp. JC074]
MKLSKKDIISQLKKEILELTLKPGDMLSEATLTERFGLSRTPIRDILKQLASEGYVKIYPQRGSLVSYIDLESVEQIVYLRNSLEKEIFRDLRKRITISQKHDLMKILNEQASCIQEKSLKGFLDYDDEFHRTCFEFAGRLFLWDVIQQFNVHYLRYRSLHMRDYKKLEDLLEEHKSLLNYLNGDDTMTIEALIHHHLRADEVNLEKSMELNQYIR